MSDQLWSIWTYCLTKGTELETIIRKSKLQLISCAITNHPLGCGYHCRHCHCHCWCCGQELTCKLYAVPGYPGTKPEIG